MTLPALTLWRGSSLTTDTDVDTEFRERYRTSGGVERGPYVNEDSVSPVSFFPDGAYQCVCCRQRTYEEGLVCVGCQQPSHVRVHGSNCNIFSWDNYQWLKNWAPELLMAPEEALPDPRTRIAADQAALTVGGEE